MRINQKTIGILFLGVILIGVGIYILGETSKDSANYREERDKQIEKELEEEKNGSSEQNILSEEETKEREKVVKELENSEHYDDNVEKSVIDGKPLPRTDVYERLSGVIRSDKINLREPIYKGASEVNMRKGVATLNTDDDLEQKLLTVSGHRAPTPNTYFREVPRLKKGDEIVIEHHENGEVVRESVYKVTNQYLVTPDKREVVEKDVDERTLQLITCDDWNNKTRTYDKRHITEAVYVEDRQIK